jgi:hypothetical protein
MIADDTELENIARETEALHSQLWSERIASKLPDQFHSCIEVPLGKWIKQKYIGKKAGEK